MSIQLDDPTPPLDQDRDRIAPRESLGTLWAIIFTGMFGWFFVPMLYGLLVVGPRSAGESGVDVAKQKLTDGETVGLSLAGSLFGLLVLMFVTALIRRDGFALLGFTRQRFARGASRGLLGALIVVPAMLLISYLTEQLWNAIHFQHENEHELLRIMGGSNAGLMKLTIIVSAVVAAPIFEELLFRGYLQTAIGGSVRWLLNRPISGTDRNSRWLGIFGASIFFALVHQHLWLMPPIFLLSIMLGYAYERTDNLWTSIVIHALFNATQVIAFLAIH